MYWSRGEVGERGPEARGVRAACVQVGACDAPDACLRQEVCLLTR